MEHITMSKKEREQLIVFTKIKNGELTQALAALQLGITERWVRKKYRRFLQDGDKGLVHLSRNKESNRRWNEQEKTLAIGLLKNDWHDFGPTFAVEKLREIKGIHVSKETLRQAMIKEGVWQINRKRPKHRKRRERRPILGEMVQLDGSPHDWFEGRGQNCTLLVFIDDATSCVLWLEFVPSESAISVVTATKNYVCTYGRPISVYVDFGSVFSVNTNNPEREKKTQWERMLQDLSINVLHARSPQAKGRVERSNGTHQDRLVKEMRLADISSIEQANEFLRTSNYIEKHNKHFAVEAAQSGDAHRTIETHDLNAVFSFKDKRILTNDFVITFNKRLFQVEKPRGIVVRPKDTIIVTTYLNGSIDLFIRKKRLEYKEIFARPSKNNVVQIVKQETYRKVHENSKRWVSGLPVVGNRGTSKTTATHVEKRN